MQTEGATDLEAKLYRLCLVVEKLPAGEWQTEISLAMNEAANKLQRMRLSGQKLVDACHLFHGWVNDHPYMLTDRPEGADFLAVYNAVCDAYMAHCTSDESRAAAGKQNEPA